jgi:23S rRNA (guanosine2251-2'-O)-methyltransferase
MRSKDFIYLYGKNSILERLLVNPQSIKKIFLQNTFKDHRILNAIRSKDIAVQIVSQKKLVRIKCADRLQGIVALADKFQYMPFKELLYNHADKNLSFIFLDNINDPHNLGSILRITACLGNFAVVIPRYSSCVVNDTVIHVASGGENFTPVAMVSNLTTALIEAKKAGYWIAGTLVNEGQDINKLSLPFPLCLVLGSEGKGIRSGIKKHLDLRIRLPMKGAALSFNVAMACAIFCYEITRQKDF